MENDVDPYSLARDLSPEVFDKMLRTGEWMDLIVSSALWHFDRGTFDDDVLSSLSMVSFDVVRFLDRLEALGIKAQPRRS